MEILAHIFVWNEEDVYKRQALCDGNQLADLMIEHNVGVTPTQAFTLKRLDSDYFETA